jgi:cell division septation protein DedD
MPDLNLLDEGGMEEESSAAAPAKPKGRGGSGGGAMKWVVIILVLVMVLGAGGFFAKQKGIWPFKKKAPAVTEVIEDQYPAEGQQQPKQDQYSALDTSQVALLETAPVEEKKEEPKAPKKEQATAESESVEAKLSEMKGAYTVQVASYRLKSNATESKSNLEIAGYPAFIDKISVKGGERYVVRIGRYESRKEAQAAAKNFGAQLRWDHTIEKIRMK